MHDNPHSLHHVAAASAAADERAAFLQRTYSWLLAGIFSFAATLWAVASIPQAQELAINIYRGGPLLFIAILFGAGFVVHRVAEKSPINVVAYFAYTVLFGLLLAPPVLYYAATGANILTQAALVTTLVFSGLTAFVFLSGRDFSFLRGALAIGLFALIGVSIAGWLFGFNTGLWGSAAGVLLFSGYILYDTSRILRHYPTTAHIPAAIALFVSVILLFQNLLHLLGSLNND